MMFRLPLLAAVALVSASIYSAQSQVITGGAAPGGRREHLGLMISMHDGIHLAADVFLPAGNARFPTVLIRTPYSRKSSSLIGYRTFTEEGYAVVIQDVRGRNASQGSFGPIVQEGPDGNDTINWIAAQSWSDGDVVMAGSSYLGIDQWWAAIQGNRHLKAISPVFSGDDEYIDRFYSAGGSLQLGHRLLWVAENFTQPSRVPPVFGNYVYHLPLRTADRAATGMSLPVWQNALDHPSYTGFWKPWSIREQLHHINIPILSFGGWFDIYAASDLDAFARLTSLGRQVETWIGPWAHTPTLRYSTRDFGPDSVPRIRKQQLSWFNSVLQPAASEQTVSTGPNTLHLFVAGSNVWREEHEWPLARTRYTPLYLKSSGHANSYLGDGELSLRPATATTPTPDSFTYDPKAPVPTIGGSTCCEAAIMPPGPLDQTPIEKRNDVLVYTSAPLNEPLEVTGIIKVTLYIATSVNDTDFTAKLVDVDAGGQPVIVCDGIQRLRYRLGLNHPVFVKRNTPYQVSVDAGVASWVFAPGHRIRLEISSSNFPKYDRNLNSMLPVGDQLKPQKARQTVFHERAYPSALILPLIPRPYETHQPFKGAVAKVRSSSSRH